MSADIATAAEVSLFDWFEKNRNRIVQAVIAAALVALVVSYFIWNKGQQNEAANEALSGVTGADAAQDYLKLVAQYPKTSAAPRALLLAASDFFAAGKFADAQAQFERIAGEYSDSPFRIQALYGVAACLDAQGKTDEAITRYTNLIQGHPNDATVSLARSALARLYEAQGKFSQAMEIYQELARSEANGSLGLESGMRAQALLAQHPEMRAKNALKDALLKKVN